MAEQQRLPGLVYPVIRHLIPAPVDDAVRIAYDNLFYLRSQNALLQSQLDAALSRLANLEARVGQRR